jgi:uncharacterized alkaline shock family protein YloU
MVLRIDTKNGEINISSEVISTVVGFATNECYGVVGMSARNIKDGIAEILKKENYSKGVAIRDEDGLVHIDIHIIVLYGVSVSEVAKLVQERVKHELNSVLNLEVSTINIKVDSVKIVE